MLFTEVNHEVPLWVSVLAAIAILAILIALFIWSFIANKRTPKPVGHDEDLSMCSGCQMTSCGHHIQEVSKIELDQTDEEEANK